MRTAPALEVTTPGGPTDELVGLLLAAIDHEAPLAVEPVPSGVRVFFATEAARDRAAAALAASNLGVTIAAVGVADEGWAERSQARLPPVTAGALTVVPPDGDAAGIVIRIQPSMGFGTGHHASTQLMLRLLQEHPCAGAAVVDVGTGSGILAIAARALGAAHVVAIDTDVDALDSARRNLAWNDAEGEVVLAEADLAGASERLGRRFDLVLANLTGAVIARHADDLARLAVTRGRLIASGVLEEEATTVVGALRSAGWVVAGRATTDGWAALTAEKTTSEVVLRKT